MKSERLEAIHQSLLAKCQDINPPQPLQQSGLLGEVMAKTGFLNESTEQTKIMIKQRLEEVLVKQGYDFESEMEKSGFMKVFEPYLANILDQLMEKYWMD